MLTGRGFLAGLMSVFFGLGFLTFLNEWTVTRNGTSLMLGFIALGFMAAVYVEGKRKQRVESAFSSMVVCSAVLSLTALLGDFSNPRPFDFHKYSLGASDAYEGTYDTTPIQGYILWMDKIGPYMSASCAVAAGCLTLACLAFIFNALQDEKWGFSKWEVVKGTMFVYVATGLVFAAAYRLTGSVAFSGEKPAAMEAFDYVYFSFICISTTGFGDVIPTTWVGKLLALVEPFIGGFVLLGIFVAAAIGMQPWPARRAADELKPSGPVGAHSRDEENPHSSGPL